MIRNFAYLSLALLLLCPCVANAQLPIFWDADEGDWNDSTKWFEEFGPPDAALGDIGVVNRGLAIVDEEADVETGGLIIGELAASTGTVHIRDNGKLEVIEDFDVTGAARVGQAGLGTLIVDRGGSFSAVSLASGGRDGSRIALGGGDSGTAEVDISGPATLARHTVVHGPNVDFSAESLRLSGTLTAEITGETHSALDINGAATLGGALDLQFVAPFAPAAGQTWNLVDADSIGGNFTSVTSNVSPGPGLSFSVSTVEGGDNGMLAQVGIDAKLQLTVNRRTGETQIQNLTDSHAITINGYGVGSRSGVIVSDNWNRFGDGWSGNGSSSHVSEVNLDGSQEIGAQTDVALGDVYNFLPQALGESNEDVFFEYHVAGGDVESGLVSFTGPHHDVVLVVDEDGAYIQNQSTNAVTINGYAIVSEAGGLAPDDWTSLADGSADWSEANAAANHMTELRLEGALTLDATSDAIPLGPIVAEGANDLVFVINLPDSGPHIATVEYDDGVQDFGGPLVGDCDGDGQLTAADLECITTILERDAVLGALNTLPGDLDGNGQVNFPDFLKLAANFNDVTKVKYTEGDVNLSGGPQFPDFLALAANFGKTPPGAAAVPEPDGLGLALLGVLAVFLGKRRRR